ncbi:hypothetical protein SAMN05421770_11714 [Granulicella rosea]|uniref:Uncharacterized protein n=1 Tax=Granulicella rosea TaxID=474952 RepID=A0A239MPG4_9BACT|nr:hypothetical protein [Granulicella rosea]SNT43992.1 hypothetical protein SAMN05421770_11714 [Granulicella rosea]
MEKAPISALYLASCWETAAPRGTHFSGKDFSAGVWNLSGTQFSVEAGPFQGIVTEKHPFQRYSTEKDPNAAAASAPMNEAPISAVETSAMPKNKPTGTHFSGSRG